MESDSDEYVSSGGEAQFLHQKKISNGAVKNKKRKRRSTKAFREGVKAKYDVDLEDVSNLRIRNNNTRRNSCRCIKCGIVKENKSQYWAGHKSKCQGLKHARERQQLRLYTGAGGEEHRQKLVDTYMLAYFVYRERLPFTMPSRMHQVVFMLSCHA